jgi:hypothetical protein
MRSSTLLAFLAAVCLISAGCFHKDVATDRADDISATLLYEGPGGPLILNLEEVFQANSKSSGGGVTHISGYVEMRISSYDLETGEMLSRVALGTQIEEANALLGYSPGKVWMFSIDPELGLHWRDPRSLEVKAKWSDLQAYPALKSFSPARPAWMLISQYFAFQWETGDVMLTDDAGYRYLLDPETFALTQTELPMPRVEWTATCISNSGQFGEDQYFSLRGDSRHVLEGLGKTSDSKVSFLFGQFLLDKDPRHAAAAFHREESAFVTQVQLLLDSLERLKAAFPDVAEEPAWSSLNMKKREAHRAYTATQRELENVERAQKRFLERSGFSHDNSLLSTDMRSAYIFHADRIADTARAHISKIVLQADSTWQVRWDTRLASLYHDASKADQAGAFEEVFSSGNPEFNYFWTGITDKHLILVAQLRMLCLDTETGQLKWDIEL